ncbi:MAG TPA: ATP-dependent helicase HrpB [Nitrospira sp.]|nr:ATP-dependent helicase HrpB [Nitrospira sp.]
MNRLPIEDVLPALEQALAAGGNALLTAPPGAGKTTVVPLALLNAPWRSGKKLLMLEPRRFAARAAAHRMASMRGEPVGAAVGYRMRLDTKIGPHTRVEVVTEGILTRLLQQDPALSVYAAILFDEFHERSLQADTGLALCLETQRLFRPDLRLLVMSATLDCGPVSDLLGHAPVISCEGRMFPVETRYLDHPLSGHLDGAVTQVIRRSLARDQGSLLVFLSGMAEIRRVERQLLDAGLGSDVMIAPLHGDLPQAAQDSAIEPAPRGTRKVVLATSIAETSLTIDGIRVVIDGGQLRAPRFDPRSGLTRLETIRVTQDSADQRRGRAGRLEPGICYRLWTEKEQAALAPRRPPEILDADLAPLMLDLAQWGTTDPSELSWLTLPPSGSVAQAKELLMRLGALDATGRITPHGKQMAELPLHPRLSHMLLKSVPLTLTGLACDLAALLSERDPLRGPTGTRQTDLRLRIDVLHGDRDHVGSASVDRGTIQRVKRTADVWRRQLGLHVKARQADKQEQIRQTGLLLALAYPDRIAQRQRSGDARYLLTNGRGALFANPDPLASEPYLVIADLDAGSQWARIDLAAPLALDDVEQLYRQQIVESEAVIWDERTKSVRASRQRRLGALVLSEQALPKPDPSLMAAALLDGVREAGLATLAWTPELQQWRTRVQFLRRMEGPDSAWRDLSDETLLRTLDEWLAPYLNGITTLERVQRLDLAQPLYALLTWEQQRDLDRLAPTHLTVPSGSKIRIEYDTPDLPVLAVRLQEMFGCKETPRVVDGKVAVMLHLLSPAKRPVQVTKDLASFWATAYQEVRKELRGRYPKHHWPDNPLAALPTAKIRKRTS